MSFRTLAVSAFLALRFAAAISSPVATAADDKLVKVPGGFVPESNFHIVPEGGKIVHTPDVVRLLDADGNILHSAPLTDTRSVFSHLNSSDTSSFRARQDDNTDIVLAIFEAPSVFSFTGTWAVPPLPQINSGQLLQYFIGLGPPSLGALLFPVLQYGIAANGGGAFWSLSTWFITGDQAFATNITNATQTTPFYTPGAFIMNDNNITDPFPGIDMWFAGFIPNIAVLQIQSTFGFNEVIVALETTGAFLQDNMPNTTTDLFQISLQEGHSSTSFPSSIPWQITSDPNDGIIMEVTSASGVSGELQIDYDLA